MSSYKMKVHKASADPSTEAYDEIAVTSIAAFEGYANCECEIRLANETFTPEGEQITFLGGERTSKREYRREYPVIFLKSTYKASDWDYSNIKAFIKSYITSEFLWLSFADWFTATEIAENYHGTGKAIPVSVSDWKVVGNEKEGTKVLNVTFEHRYKNK
jgi:hypothetical protein